VNGRPRFFTIKIYYLSFYVFLSAWLADIKHIIKIIKYCIKIIEYQYRVQQKMYLVSVHGNDILACKIKVLKPVVLL